MRDAAIMRWLIVGFGSACVCLSAAVAVPRLLAIPSAGQSPAADPPGIPRSLDALASLLARVPRDGALVANTDRARSAVARLQALSTKWPAESPADYRANMDRHVRNLQGALDGSDAGRRAAVLEAIADDLEIKLEHCVNSGGRLGGSVSVRVRTVRGGQEVRNYQVFYLPRVLDAVGGATADRFPQLSSPTSDVLVPGRYVVWSRDPSSGRLGEKTIVKVGEGRKDLVLDLSVPAQ